ncbi:hypothetical protein HPP92_019898 [Vanilla planifolia]|uniref:Uncharacterized protein n=1 Tax=Vanilla planifolia TaxID=51239 RepID=A0A835Q681_VANPL|nr:hypothetical protein HPP92_019898 [Vanilla planifolia]
MVCVSFTGLLLGVLFSFLAVEHFTAAGRHASVMATGVTPGVHEIKGLHVGDNFRMGSKKSLGIMQSKMRASVSREGNEKIMSTGTKSSLGGAGHLDDPHEGMGKLSIGCKMSGFRVIHPTNVKLVGQVPFNADYYTPQTHPSRHN